MLDTGLDAILGRGRAAAAARMTDTCRIIEPVAPNVDITTGHRDVTVAIVYEGPCRFVPTANASSTPVGAEDTVGSNLRLDLPIAGSEQVGRTNQTVVCLTAANDASLPGHRYGVLGSAQGSQQTARRIPIRKVTSWPAP